MTRKNSSLQPPLLGGKVTWYQAFIIHFLKQRKVEGATLKSGGLGYLISLTKKKLVHPRHLLHIHFNNPLLLLFLFANPWCTYS